MAKHPVVLKAKISNISHTDTVTWPRPMSMKAVNIILLAVGQRIATNSVYSNSFIVYVNTKWYKQNLPVNHIWLVGHRLVNFISHSLVLNSGSKTI